MSSQLGLQLLRENLGLYKLVSDIANIDYTNGEKLLSDQCLSSNAITEPYCDKLRLVKICEKSIWNDRYSNECQKYLEEQFLKITSTQSKYSIEPYNEAPVSPNTQGLDEVRKIIQEKDVDKIYSNPVCIFYNVNLKDIEIKKILRITPNLSQTLEQNHFFVMELHITQDFAGIFNKTEMCDYLIKNYNFCYDDDGGDELQTECNVIQNKNMGIDIVTWKSSNTKIRIYNKFISQITNPETHNKIGNLVVKFIDCPNTQLQKTFLPSKAKEHGITRLEVIIYNFEYDGSKKIYEPLSDCLLLLEQNRKFLEEEDAPMYSVSIAKMWQKLTDALHNSCCVVCDNILQFAYWGNSCTGEFTGVQVVLSENLIKREDQINYALSQFSFNNLPMNYLKVTPKKNKIVQKCYTKTGETFFTESNRLHQTIPFDIDISSTGLIPTNHVIPAVLRRGKQLHLHSIMEIKPTFMIRESIYPADSASSSREVESHVDNLSAALQSITIENEEPTALETNQTIPDQLTSPNRLQTELDDMSNAMGTMSIHNETNEEQAMVEIAERLSFEFHQSSPPKVEQNSNDANLPIEINTIKIKKEEKEQSTVSGKSSIQLHKSESNLNDIFDEKISIKNDDDEELHMLEIAKKLSQEFRESNLQKEESKLNDKNQIDEKIAAESEEKEEEIVEETKIKLLDYFKEKNWKNLDSTGTYEIFAFTVKRKGIHSYVGILASKKNENGKNIYNLKGTQKDRFIRCYNKTEFLTKQGYLVSTSNGLKIIHLATENAFSEFETNGMETFQGNSLPKIQNIIFHTDGWPENDQILGETRESLLNLFLWKNWKNLNLTGEYQVYAFTVNNYVKYPCVGILAKQKNIHSKHVYFVKGSAKITFMDLYRDRDILKFTDYSITSCNNLDVVYLTTEQPLAEFKTNGIDTYKNRQFSKIEDLQFFYNTNEKYKSVESEVVDEEHLSFDETREELSILFKKRNWKRLNQTGEYMVYAFTIDEELYYPCAGVLAKKENEDSKHVYYIERKNIEDFEHLYRHRELLTMESYNVIKLEGFDVMFLATKYPLAEFKVHGMDSKDGHTFFKIVDINFYR